MSDPDESISTSLSTESPTPGIYDREQHNLDTTSDQIRSSPSDVHMESQKSSSSDPDEAMCQCKRCLKYFPNTSLLKGHFMACIPVVFDEKPNNEYKCSQCDATFATKRQRGCHQRIHTKYKCSDCDETFATKRQRNRHQEIHSNQGKGYKCSYCPKYFDSALKHSRHEQYHTQKRPHKCSYCEKSFGSPSSLLIHERYHTGERPYKCDLCDKAFVNATTLGYHKQSHTKEQRFKCAHCEKAFVVPSLLRAHERTHTGDKPYQCNQCDAAFSTNSQLKKHKQYHNGVKQYKRDRRGRCKKASDKTRRGGAYGKLKCPHCDEHFEEDVTGYITHVRVCRDFVDMNVRT